MKKLMLNADNAPADMVRFFGLYGMFQVKLIPHRKTMETEKFEVYGCIVENGTAFFHDLEAMVMLVEGSKDQQLDEDTAMSIAQLRAV